MKEKQSAAFVRLLEVMDRLRAECPWDREQTFLSLRNNTIEEVYELIDAIVGGQMEEIKKELGDVLLHVVFYAKIASEQGAFDIGDVADALCDKLIFRHPHVFGQVDAATSDQVSRNWEQLKLREKNRKEGGVLSGVPASLPAMIKAYRIGQKAASAGFEWKKREDVWDKVREELAEVESEMRAGRHEAMEEEFGDALFALVNAARMYGVDPELALEQSNRKFIRRFAHIEASARQRDIALKDLTLDQMEELWQQAKATKKK